MTMIGHDHICEDEYFAGLSGFGPGVANNLFDQVFLKDRQTVVGYRGQVVARFISCYLNHALNGGVAAKSILFDPAWLSHAAHRWAKPKDLNRNREFRPVRKDVTAWICCGRKGRNIHLSQSHFLDSCFVQIGYDPDIKSLR